MDKSLAHQLIWSLILTQITLFTLFDPGSTPRGGQGEGVLGSQANLYEIDMGP